MTLFISLCLALIHGLSRFIPMGPEAHERLFERLLDWPAVDPLWKSTFALGGLLALAVFFIHDWASILSSFIQVVISRRKPMTFDERFPFFLIFFSAIPAGAYWYVKEQLLQDPEQLLNAHSDLGLAAGLLGGGVLLMLGERWNKRSRGLFDINLLDSLLFGASQCLAVVPGFNGSVGMMVLALFRNYHLEAATKLIALFSLPLLGFEAGRILSFLDWSAPQPFDGTSWWQWSLAVGVAGAATFLSLRIFTEAIRRSGYGKWNLYRIVLAVTLLGLHFL